MKSVLATILPRNDQAIAHFFRGGKGGGGLREFQTVMQIRDVVEGFHNFREFSQPPSV